ncbi:MAG: hypothetical protein MUF61_03605 [archaeon]|nr:hypothetical protein [archaeon]
MIKSIILTNWERREIIGCLLNTVERGDRVILFCEEGDGINAREVKILGRYGSRIEKRADMEVPDGLIVRHGLEMKLIPYSAITDFEIIGKRKKVPMMGGNYSC